jgi:hypothetical protein
MTLFERFHWLVLRLAHHATVTGVPVPVALLHSGWERDILLEKIHDAISLIERYDPRTFEQLRQVFRAILVFGTPDIHGRYWPNLETCQLNDSYISHPATSPVDIAAVIVHETMHARLHRRGIHITYENRARVERVCIRAERAFALRVPDADAVVRQADRRLAYPSAIYTREAELERRVHAGRQLGIPTWALRLLSRRHGVASPAPPTPPPPTPVDAPSKLQDMIEAITREDATLGERRTRYGIDLAGLDGRRITIALFGLFGDAFKYVARSGRGSVGADGLSVELDNGTRVPISARLLRRVQRLDTKKRKRWRGADYLIIATVGPRPADLTPADCLQFGITWPTS